jgi:hypothetical protein
VENEISLALIGALYLSVETVKYLVTKKNGTARNGRDSMLLKLEEERNTMAMQAVTDTREWQKDINEDIVVLSRENAMAHQALLNSIERLLNSEKKED